MIAAFRTPARRIALAIALSVLIHAFILWLPYIQLPHTRVQLPPLSVRLESLPKPAVAITETPKDTKPVSAIPLAKSDDNVSTDPAEKAMAEINKTEETTAIQPFPKHLQLNFIVYKGEDGFRAGEIRQRLDVSGGRYTLKSVRQTSGLDSLSNNDRLIQTSFGKIGEHGLQPDAFEEEKVTAGEKQDRHSTFDRTSGKLRFSNGNEADLPGDAQDILSFTFQLSQLPMNGQEYFSLPVGDAGQLQQYQIEIGADEIIPTPMGRLRALHLRKMHAQGEAYFEIWLGLEYRLLPVKLRQVDSSGNVTEEFEISDIRAAQE